MLKKALFSALLLLFIGQSWTLETLEDSNEPILDSEEIVPQETEAALLRNFFTVNLSRNRKQKRPPVPNQPNVSDRRKAGTQRKRLNDLFVALSDPVGCKF